jgi:hypothetical protein
METFYQKKKGKMLNMVEKLLKALRFGKSIQWQVLNGNFKIFFVLLFGCVAGMETRIWDWMKFIIFVEN